MLACPSTTWKSPSVKGPVGATCVCSTACTLSSLVALPLLLRLPQLHTTSKLIKHRCTTIFSWMQWRLLYNKNTQMYYTYLFNRFLVTVLYQRYLWHVSQICATHSGSAWMYRPILEYFWIFYSDCLHNAFTWVHSEMYMSITANTGMYDHTCTKAGTFHQRSDFQLVKTVSLPLSLGC